MYKILYGIPAMTLPIEFNKHNLNENNHIENYVVENNMDIWCDFELDYYPKEDYYKFEFETMLVFDTPEACKNWLSYCLDVLTDYMVKHKLNTKKELNMYEVFTDGINITSKFKSIEDAYACLKMYIYGFNGTDWTNTQADLPLSNNNISQQPTKLKLRGLETSLVD